MLHQLSAAFVGYVHREVIDDALALVIVKAAHLLVADPEMDASSPRVDPEDVLISEVFGERLVQDFPSDPKELPALQAHSRSLTAVSHVPIIGHIDINHHLLLFWNHMLLLLGNNVEHRADIVLLVDCVRLKQELLHQLRTLKGHVSHVEGLASKLDFERKLAPLDVARSVLAPWLVHVVAEPPEELLVREEVLVVDLDIAVEGVFALDLHRLAVIYLCSPLLTLTTTLRLQRLRRSWIIGAIATKTPPISVRLAIAKANFHNSLKYPRDEGFMDMVVYTCLPKFKLVSMTFLIIFFNTIYFSVELFYADIQPGGTLLQP